MYVRIIIMCNAVAAFQVGIASVRTCDNSGWTVDSRACEPTAGKK